MLDLNLVHIAMDASQTGAAGAAGDAAANAAASGGLFPIFKLAIAAYLLYTAILGKGKMFENKFLKCSQAKYRLIIRLTAAASGVFVLANAALEFFFYGREDLRVLITVLWALGFAAMLGMLVLSIVLVDRKALEAARKEEEANLRQNRSDPLRAAFVFDEDEEEAASGESRAENGKDADNSPYYD